MIPASFVIILAFLYGFYKIVSLSMEVRNLKNENKYLSVVNSQQELEYNKEKLEFLEKLYPHKNKNLILD